MQTQIQEISPRPQPAISSIVFVTSSANINLTGHSSLRSSSALNAKQMLQLATQLQPHICVIYTRMCATLQHNCPRVRCPVSSPRSCRNFQTPSVISRCFVVGRANLCAVCSRVCVCAGAGPFRRAVRRRRVCETVFQ